MKTQSPILYCYQVVEEHNTARTISDEVSGFWTHSLNNHLFILMTYFWRQ